MTLTNPLSIYKCRNNNGSAQSALGRKAEAIACCDRALEIDPRFAVAWNTTGTALSDLGRREEAVEAYRRFISCVPASNKQLISVRRRINHGTGKSAKIPSKRENRSMIGEMQVCC